MKSIFIPVLFLKVCTLRVLKTLKKFVLLFCSYYIYSTKNNIYLKQNNMRQLELKKMLTILLFFLGYGIINAQGEVIVYPPEQGPSGEHGANPKAPVQIPTVYYEDYVLMFDSSCIGCTIELVQNDEVVFTGVVDTNGEVEIPETLVGLVELRIYRGGISFVGEFEP